MQSMISFTTEDGVASKLTIFKTDDSSFSAPLLIFFPAMGVAASYYEGFAHRLSEEGIHVITADFRGHGHSAVRPSRSLDFGYHELLAYEYPKVIDIAREHFPDHPIYLAGHSLGGQLSALFLAANPELAKGLILMASCSVYYKGWEGNSPWKVLWMAQLSRAISSILGYYPGEQIGFAGREARSVMHDWAFNARTGRYVVKNSPHDYEALMPDLVIPILSVTLAGDWMAPRLAADKLCDKFKSARIDRIEINAAQAGLSKVSHFSWVKQPDYFARFFGDWIKKEEERNL